MKRTIVGSLLLTCCLALEVSAQRVAPVNTRHVNDSYTPRTTFDPFEKMKVGTVSASSRAFLEGLILAVNAAENSFVVEQQDSKRRFNIPLNPKTVLKADKGTALAGRKTLTVADFKAGQRVKVIYTPGPRVAEVRLRRDKT